MEKYISRRRFIRKCGAAVAGSALLGAAGVLTKRGWGKKPTVFWQIDPDKCVQCGLCETACVLSVSAAKCVHASKVCGYCDLCGAYFLQNVKNLNTGAENLMCPTGAIARKFVEDPYFEYTIDESLCIGCAKCAKGCNAFGNGSLYMQIKQDLCKNCNECEIARVCPAQAIKRVSLDEAYDLKGG